MPGTKGKMVYKGFNNVKTQKCLGVGKIKGLGGVLCKTEEWGAIRVQAE